MGALDVLAQLSAMGLTLTVQGETIRTEPKAAITDEARQLIRANKTELLAALREIQSHAETPGKSVTQTATASSTSLLLQTRTNEADGSHAEPASISDDCTELFEERAGIMEYDGGLSRDDAEAAAREATEKHRRECFERLEKAANAILSLPTRAMQKRELAKYCAGKSATACAEMRGWLAYRSRGDDLK